MQIHACAHPTIGQRPSIGQCTATAWPAVHSMRWPSSTRYCVLRWLILPVAWIVFRGSRIDVAGAVAERWGDWGCRSPGLRYQTDERHQSCSGCARHGRKRALDSISARTPRRVKTSIVEVSAQCLTSSGVVITRRAGATRFKIAPTLRSSVAMAQCREMATAVVSVRPQTGQRRLGSQCCVEWRHFGPWRRG